MDANEKKELCKEICIHNRLCELLCESKNGCTKCEIREFKDKYDIRIDNCEAIFMAAELLGYNESTARFIEDLYKNKRNEFCSKVNCSECYIHDINHYSPINLSCLEIYIGLNLLKDVQ